MDYADDCFPPGRRASARAFRAALEHPEFRSSLGPVEQVVALAPDDPLDVLVFAARITPLPLAVAIATRPGGLALLRLSPPSPDASPAPELVVASTVSLESFLAGAALHSGPVEALLGELRCSFEVIDDGIPVVVPS